MDAMIFAECIMAKAVVSTCRTILRIARSFLPRFFALVFSPLGGSAKLADYIAVASSLSPPK